MEVSSGCGLGVWGVSFSLGGDRGEKGSCSGPDSEETVKEGSFLPASLEGGGCQW